MTEETKKIHAEKTVDDKIELIKSIGDVQSKINDVISGDFVLSKLTPQEKEYIIEMTNNAFLSRKLLKRIQEKATRWNWYVEEQEWREESLTDEEYDEIEQLIQKCFDTYMNRIYMINILNRNVPKNYIVEKISGIKDEVEEEETRLQSLTEKVKKRLGVSNDEER